MPKNSKKLFDQKILKNYFDQKNIEKNDFAKNFLEIKKNYFCQKILKNYFDQKNIKKMILHKIF